MSICFVGCDDTAGIFLGSKRENMMVITCVVFT